MDNKNYQDHFFRKAKDKGYRSRSAFKLIELNTKFKFLKNNIKLLDVGSFPGGWSQVVKEKIKNGKILGIDKKKTEEIKGIKFITGDFSDEKSKVAINNYFNSSIDVILSDMAANTTGNKSLDCIRTNQLCLDILDFSKEILNKKGIVISKLFMGEDFKEIKTRAKKYFKKIDFFKPNSSRDESRETYIHCSGLST
ncbi:MAG: 50S rRNA methyltransferase [Candidatus Marinimicrobia bacterium]|nr:50S rRNA methyltransferase [Candidatus Neomarinimicrobiota bacterium]RPG05177.1 MAG: RlmE family RNA methyltransferase [Pelagibacteraceae bacterium TMED247]|tara:strand:- start:3716 stop:4303 length:588 start_codon:yes stop_codon:yes gene_type:complete